MKHLLIGLFLAILITISNSQAFAAGFNDIQNSSPKTATTVVNATATPTPSPEPSYDPSQMIRVPKPSIVKIEQIGYLIGALAAAMIILAAVLAFIYLIWGGIQWITSGGDKAGMEAARNKIVNAIVGLIIVASAWAIMTLVQNFLGITILGGTIEIPKPFAEASPTPVPSPTPSPSPSPTIIPSI